jgi:hypothetical protein
MGYIAAGTIPQYAYRFDGSSLEGTIVMWKAL